MYADRCRTYIESCPSHRLQRDRRLSRNKIQDGRLVSPCHNPYHRIVFVDTYLFMVSRQLRKQDWYIQSMLVGIPKIFVGLRKDGRLQCTQTIRVEEMEQSTWDIPTRLTWAYKVLSTIREVCMQGNSGLDGHRVWRTQVRGPSHGIQIRELDEEEVRKLNPGEERVGILPKWYVDGLNDLELSLRKAETISNLQTSRAMIRNIFSVDGSQTNRLKKIQSRRPTRIHGFNICAKTNCGKRQNCECYSACNAQ